INASHHMNEQTLKNFIAQAAKLKAHIIILEPLERKFSHLLLSILACSSGLTMPFLGKKKLTKRINEILIYYSGLGLLIQSFDGIISTLRQRTKKEWKQHIIDHPYRLEQRKKLGTFKNFSLTILE